MRRIAILLILLLTLTVSQALAHPPTDIKITFDPKTKLLQAVIMHNVKDPLKHFIKKVTLSLNGKEIITHAISRQDNLDSQTLSYLIPDAQAGDLLSVKGECSIIGMLEKEQKVQ